MNGYFAGNNVRPFYMQVLPSWGPWFQNRVNYPLCVPGTAFRNGSPCFPYSMAVGEYPAFPVPQSPLTPTYNQTPVILMPPPTQPQPCDCFGEGRQTVETQTDPEQAGDTYADPDIRPRAVRLDAGSATSAPAAPDADTRNGPAKTDGTFSRVAPDRRRPSGDAPNAGGTLARSAASEKETVRVEPGSGRPAEESGKKVKERVPASASACGERRPGKAAQHDAVSQPSRGTRGALPDAAGVEDVAGAAGEGSARLRTQCLGDAGEEDVVAGAGVDMNFDEGQNGLGTVPQILPTTGKARAELPMAESQSDGKERECELTALSQLPQDRPLRSGGAEPDDLSLQLGARKNLSGKKRQPGSPEDRCPSPPQLAPGKEVDRALQVETRASERQRPLGPAISGADLEAEGYEDVREDSEAYAPQNADMEGQGMWEEFYDEEEEEDIEVCDGSGVELPYEEDPGAPTPALHSLHNSDPGEGGPIQADEAIQPELGCPEDPCLDECAPSQPDCGPGSRSDAHSKYKGGFVWPESPYTSGEEDCFFSWPCFVHCEVLSDDGTDGEAGAPEAPHSLSGEEESAGPDRPASVGFLGRAEAPGTKARKSGRFRSRKDDMGKARPNWTGSPKMKTSGKRRETEAGAPQPHPRMICMLKGPSGRSTLTSGSLGNGDIEYEVEGLFQEVRGHGHLIFRKGRVYEEIGSVAPSRSEGSIPAPFSFSRPGGVGRLQLGAAYERPATPNRLKVEEGCETIYFGLQNSSPTDTDTDTQEEWQCETWSSDSREFVESLQCLLG